jgi:hypothetical protein
MKAPMIAAWPPEKSARRQTKVAAIQSARSAGTCRRSHESAIAIAARFSKCSRKSWGTRRFTCSRAAAIFDRRASLAPTRTDRQQTITCCVRTYVLGNWISLFLGDDNRYTTV